MQQPGVTFFPVTKTYATIKQANLSSICLFKTRYYPKKTKHSYDKLWLSLLILRASFIAWSSKKVTQCLLCNKSR